MNKFDDLPPVLTVPEAAKLLRLGRNSLYRGVQRGEVPAIRVGRRLLVPRASLERLLGLEVGAGAQSEEDAMIARFNAKRKLWLGAQQ